jgi:hypothetical protein
VSAPTDLERLQSYDEFTGRLWRDKRATPLVRELLLACAYVLEHDETVNDPGAKPTERGAAMWKGVRELMGANDRGRPRYKDAVAADAPRYEPPNTWPYAACEAPRIRVREPQRAVTTIECALPHHPHLGECRPVKRIRNSEESPVWKPAPVGAVCGGSANPELKVVERDLRTGWETVHWFCTRHKDHAARVRAQVERAGEAPVPVPNKGGLLPCYFKADWAKMYAKCDEYWTPPMYGLCADDWPTTPEAAQLVPKRPRLRLIIGDLVDA